MIHRFKSAFYWKANLAFLIYNRNRATLLEAIRRRIAMEQQSVAMDGWLAYRNIDDLLPEKYFEEHK